MKKSIRITNKYRFITFVTVMVLVLSMAIGALFPVVAASPKHTVYTEIKVQAGDTLWELAKKYCSTCALIEQANPGGIAGEKLILIPRAR